MRFRRIMLGKFGLKYCTGCRTWMKDSLVPLAKCRECENERYRNIYRNTKLGQLKRAATKARKMTITPLPVKIQKLLLEMFGGLCAYCGINEADTFDHIVPVVWAAKRYRTTSFRPVFHAIRQNGTETCMNGCQRSVLPCVKN